MEKLTNNLIKAKYLFTPECIKAFLATDRADFVAKNESPYVDQFIYK